MRSIKNSIIRFSLIVLLLVLIILFSKYISTNEAITNLVSSVGYFGVLVAALIGGFNFIAPIPAITLMPVFLEAGLDKWGVILVIALGATIADSVAYLLGKAGREISLETKNEKIIKIVKKIKSIGNVPAYVFLFLFASFAPLPNEVIVAPYAFLGYKYRYIFPIVFVGNFIFNTLGSFGVDLIV